jgi:peptide methionine sulfoxide reductase MsrB
MKTTFLKEADRNGHTTYYDSVTGMPLFTAPIGRTFEDFERESRKHGWPSFRDQEVHWENVRCLRNGEAVSLAGTHLGHNLPDRNGNRYCINLVSVAGRPVVEEYSQSM